MISRPAAMRLVSGRVICVLSLAPLSSGAREWACFVGEDGSVDDVGESALEDAQAFPAAVATVLTAIEQFTSLVGNTGPESRRCGAAPR